MVTRWARVLRQSRCRLWWKAERTELTGSRKQETDSQTDNTTTPYTGKPAETVSQNRSLTTGALLDLPRVWHKNKAVSVMCH